MNQKLQQHLAAELAKIQAAGLYKDERILATPQGARIAVAGADGRELLNFCANNYLGLSNDPAVVAAAHAALDRWGYGLSSVRFICGTQSIHKALEKQVSTFLGTDDTILYGSCFDANGAVFEPLFTHDDAIISDALNHASIIDGIRLSKARRLRYRNCDLADLEAQLRAAAGARLRLIATDGVFSMDGSVAPLDGICDLADHYDAAVMVDDSHAVGVIGATGRGTPEYRHCLGRVDILTGTFGKALGGATGGYTSGRQEIIALLRQRSRPYLFSNSLPPMMAAASLAVLERLSASSDAITRLTANARRFRAGMLASGFELAAGEHPIVPILLGDAVRAKKMAEMLLQEGIYVVAFSYPVVPQGKARIRVQISAAHLPADIDRAVAAFAAVRDRLAAFEA